MSNENEMEQRAVRLLARMLAATARACPWIHRELIDRVMSHVVNWGPCSRCNRCKSDRLLPGAPAPVEEEIARCWVLVVDGQDPDPEITLSPWQEIAKACEDCSPVGTCEQLPALKAGFDQIPEQTPCQEKTCPKIADATDGRR